MFTFGILTLPLCVRGRIARIVLDPEGRAVGADLLTSQLRADGAVHLAVEGDGLARIGCAPEVVPVDSALAMFSETTRSRADCASSPEPAMRKEACNGSIIASGLHACEQHAVERLDDVGVERIAAVDLAGLHHFLLEAHRIAGLAWSPKGRRSSWSRPGDRSWRRKDARGW